MTGTAVERLDDQDPPALACPELFATCGGIQICYQSFGDPSRDTLLLIMGLAGQMITWPDDFCAQLAAAGPFHVVRFDNRDCGRSTHLDSLPAPHPAQVVLKRATPPYTLEDVAADALALLDHLEVARAHLVGASMGGMTAQLLAIRAPERVRSLVSIMSNTGRKRSGQPSLRAWPHLLKSVPRERTQFVAQLSATLAAFASPTLGPDRDWLRSMLEKSFDRGATEEGLRRQMAAVLSAPNRTRQLGRLAVPTLVIHGRKDPVVASSGGRATARAIPGANLLELKDMGHDLPRELWPLIISGIVSNAQRTPGPSI